MEEAMGESGQQIANIGRLHEFMDAGHLAGVVVRSGINVTYLSGIAYPGTLSRHLDLTGSVRGVLLLWPRKGEPILVCDYSNAGVTRRDATVKRIELYEAYVDSAYACLSKVLKKEGLDGERVGFEKDYVSALHWQEVQGLLPQLQMEDCSELLEKVRWIKTPAEIALLRKGADLLDDAYLEVFPTIRNGETERDVHSRIVGSCIRRGAGWAHGILNTSRNPVLYGGEGDAKFLTGDLVRTDYIAYLNGYPGHQSRMAVLGTPSADQKRQYAVTREIHMKTIDKCRPGVLAKDVYQFVIDEGAKHGVKHTASIFGHGVGPWFHQQEPIVTSNRNIPLEEGMVLAVEPHHESWHIQDMIVVRRNGPELISPKFPTDELYVIEA
jgi:Xaa-Pro aminopeptidase